MPSSTSIATIAPACDTLSSSHIMSSSILSSSTSSRLASSQISKIYRQSSTLFLTRRLPESLSTILPVISSSSDEDTVNDASGESAPIARASRTTRIKVWSLYLTILNAVLELDPEEGKSAFGSTEYRNLVSKVRDGDVWDEVVSNGYGGEGDVDSDVVINLATLLLAHARTQKVNQQRLENYLAASTTPNLDLNSRLQTVQNGARSSTKGTGTDTPRDLNARVKILELYTLHVLLRNNEWDYAREFINISEILDEERREAFLQALQSLQDEQEEGRRREREARLYEEEIKERERKERKEDERARERAIMRSEEEDYGVEESPVIANGNESQKARSMNGSTKGSSARNKALTSTARSSKPPTKAVAPPPSFIQRASTIIANLRTVLENMAVNSSRNPFLLLQLLICIVGVLLVVGKRNVRERVKRLFAQGFAKVQRTAGMGVKVSYI
ncbi:peroxin 26 [Calycina marina]|uniref:Peroxin 26 n=1 Tax=Calycina marina TaxID=1763456 RepID=A0A9P7Z999_9HELO|nr:peroxin 26 [Calycina marina]